MGGRNRLLGAAPLLVLDTIPSRVYRRSPELYLPVLNRAGDRQLLCKQAGNYPEAVLIQPRSGGPHPMRLQTISEHRVQVNQPR